MPLNLAQFEKNARKLKKALKKPKRVDEPEFVHKLRTRARKFESTFEATEPGAKRSDRRLLRPLGKIRKEAGKVRDMDVLTAHLAQARLNDKDGSLVPVFEEMGAQRRHHAQKLSRMMRRKGARIGKRLKRAVSRVRRDTEREPKNPAQAQSTVRAARTVLQISRTLAVPITLNHTNLHQYRKKIKQLRYILQAASNGASEELVKALGECKDAIGEWHDWEVLGAMASEIAEGGPRSGPIEELASVREEKFDRALNLTRQMRTKYLGISGTGKRQSKRRRAAAARPSREIVKAVGGVVE